MLLLDALEKFTDERGEAVGRVSENHLFAAVGKQLDPVVTIEMIAQSAAAHEGYRRRQDGRVVGGGLAGEILRAFLGASFEGGRHERRLDKIIDFEKRQCSE